MDTPEWSAINAANGSTTLDKTRRRGATPDDADRKRIKLTAAAQAALAELRTLIAFSGEDEADILSSHVIAERDNRVSKLRKGVTS